MGALLATLPCTARPMTRPMSRPDKSRSVGKVTCRIRLIRGRWCGENASGARGAVCAAVLAGCCFRCLGTSRSGLGGLLDGALL